MMRRVTLWFIGVFCAASAVAQPPPTPPTPVAPRPAPGRPAEPTGPQGEQKLRWVCRQLRLDDQQMQQAEALIATYHAELADLQQNAADLLQRIQDKAAEVKAAQTAGDVELTHRLQEELRNMAPLVQAENHFFEQLTPVLNDEQKGRLGAVRKRAETAGDVSLRPVHVLRAARKLGLTPEQNVKLEALLAEYRSAAAAARSEKPEAAEERVEQFVKNVRAILTPEQSGRYDKAIGALRDDPPVAQAFQPPVATTQPAPEPTPAPGLP